MAIPGQPPLDRVAKPQLSAIAFVRDEDTEAAVAAYFSSAGISDVRLVGGDIDQAIKLLGHERSPRLLIVDISGEPEPTLKLGRVAELCDPSTTVIVVGDRNDLALYRNLKYLGVAEYFYKPLVPDLFASACALAFGHQQDTGNPRDGHLVTVLGVRGGVGATTIAVNTAWHLAEVMKRHTVLLDLDLQGGDAALHLDAKPSNALLEVLKNPDRLDGLFVERAVTQLSERLDILSTLAPLNDTADVDEAAVLALIGRLQERYRYVVVDLPFWAAARFPQLLHLRATLVLVTDETIASARDTLRWKAQIDGKETAISTVIALNKAHAPGALSGGDFARALGNVPEITVPFHASIVESGDLGLPAIANSTPFRDGLAPLFKRLTGEPGETHNSLLHRVFGR
jgi:pilus assembly protein CpaE